MKILVCNVGSTSLKYQLFDMSNEKVIAKGKIERVGKEDAIFSHEDSKSKFQEIISILNHEKAIEKMLDSLLNYSITSLDELDSVGFKVVVAKNYSGVQFLDEKVIQAMEELNYIAPAHNPPYIAAIKHFKKIAPYLPLVGSFETGFHDNIPKKAYTYAIPKKYNEEYGIRKFGYHGASHEYVNNKIKELTGLKEYKLISCHLGGSGSLSAIKDGISLDNSLGFSLQTGIIHNNRSGDIDPFIPIILMEKFKMPLEEVKELLTKESGLYGLSGISNDVRDLELAMSKGSIEAKEALEKYAYEIKKYLGSYIAVLGGVDVIAFAGGIGENSAYIRLQILNNLETLGIELDEVKNKEIKKEGLISKPTSRVKIYVIATDEEIIVARKTKELLEKTKE